VNITSFEYTRPITIELTGFRGSKRTVVDNYDRRSTASRSASTCARACHITVGRRLGGTVRASLTSGLAEDPQLRSTIEWRLGRSFTVEPSYDRINTVSSSNLGNFGMDFRWRLEFD
jgi:translocation and assembly module TamB